MPAYQRPRAALSLLAEGELEMVGRMPWSSNATFLVEVRDTAAGEGCRGVYKPVRGERPLWDFPPGLHRREVAAFELADALGWGVVPPTVLRAEGPLGEGSVQRFEPSDFEQHYFTILEDPDHHRALQQICLLDLVANNTDRKGGHVLAGLDGSVWAIDNGLCFAVEPKLRTVIWDFAGEPIPADMLASLDALGRAAPPALCELLEPDEAELVLKRAAALARVGTFPEDRTGRRWPWPLV